MKISMNNKDITPAIELAFEALKVELCDGCVALVINKSENENGIHIIKEKDTISLTYYNYNQLFRGLSIIAGRMENFYEIHEQPAFETCGVMIDCSRNAVPKVETIKELLVKFALMGHNVVQLYTEDTYKIEGEPLFGYMRGSYTEAELCELSTFAALFGIDLIPCIQTLAHLNGMFKHQEYSEINDFADILLCDEEKTYVLIEKMISNARKCFKSNRINIGMDEAMMLGKGRYYAKHGDCNRFELMCRHLDRVVKICEKYDFHPMMWSDMFFHILKGNIDTGADFMSAAYNEELFRQVPKGVDLIHWAYYIGKKEHYDKNFSAHKMFGNNIIFAGGAHKWHGFVPRMQYGIRLARVASNACAENGINEVFCTLWGDDGGEASVYSVLPTVAAYAELCYNLNISDEELNRRIKVCTGIDYDSFKNLDLPDFPEKNFDWIGCNPSKYLLYNDPLLGLFDNHVESGFPQYYKSCSKIIRDSESKSPSEYSRLFKTMAALCDVLAEKATVGIDTYNAYHSNNKEALALIAKRLKRIAYSVNDFKECVRDQWFNENKSSGFEVQDIRLAGVAARCESAAVRINDYLCGAVNELDELSEERLNYCAPSEKDTVIICANHWDKMTTPNRLA